MKDYLLSIIIPIYQVEEYIADCLYSICKQNTSISDWFEIICVNDGTKDNSMEIVKRIASEYSQISFNLIDKENGGVSDARNVGLDNAKGSYIWFVDSDDVILQGSLELFYQHIYTYEYDIVSALFLTSNIVNINKWVYKGGNKNHKAFYTSCIKRQLLNNHRIKFVKGIAYGEDLLFFEIVSFFAKSKKQLQEIVYTYRQRPGSAMNDNSQGNKYIRSLEKRLEIYQELSIKYDNKNNEFYFTNLRNCAVRNILLYHLKNNDKHPDELLKELKNKGVYPYPLRWKDLCEYYALSDYIIKMFCFLFPFSWYYKLTAKCYSLIIKNRKQNDS